jgi:hypothetical protein
MENTINKNQDYQNEDQLQAQCIMWFSQEYPGLRGTLFAVPNGGARDSRTANLLKATGVVAGVSDLIWILHNKIEFIEMKKPGGRQSGAQKKFQEMVEFYGYNYNLIFSFVEFKTLIKSKLNE